MADDGYNSRKLHLSYFTTAMLFLAGMVASKYPSFAPLYETFVGGACGVLAIYVTGNVGHHFIAKPKSTESEVSEDLGSESSEAESKEGQKSKS